MKIKGSSHSFGVTFPYIDNLGILNGLLISYVGFKYLAMPNFIGGWGMGE